MQLTFRAMAIAACALVASCGEGADDTPSAQADTGPAVADEKVEEPELFADSETAARAVPPVACAEGAFCEGPLVVRADGMNLVPDRSRTMVSGTIVIENRTSDDLRVILMDTNPTVALDNGISGASNLIYAMSGLNRCSRSGADCFGENPGSFRLLAPGDSPAKVTFKVPVISPAEMAPSMRKVEKADTLTFQLFSVAASGEKRLHQVSLADVPLQNRLAE
jgi:hypothetical protein